ncbi:MAG: DUF3124 domain-containing protein [Sulfuricella sp.]|nr:DUF3124 domain-containing protein [Sulfuricella sp.]
MKLSPLFSCLLAATLLAASPARADDITPSKGQTLYLPIYSHLWHGDLKSDGMPFKSLVSALVSVRNTDLKTPIRVTSARYYDTNGKLLQEFVPTPKTIPAMGTHELYVERKESAGGSGANFVVQWESAASANPPVVEALHADIQGNRTITFLTWGRPIRSEK